MERNETEYKSIELEMVQNGTGGNVPMSTLFDNIKDLFSLS